MYLSAVAIEQVEITQYMPIFLLDDCDLEITFGVIRNCFQKEILSFLKNNNSYGISCVRSSTMKKFIEEITHSHQNSIKDYDVLVQELFILHQTCKGFYLYNEKFLNLSYNDFRSRIFYPNIMYLLVRFLNKAHRFLQKIIRMVFNEFRSKEHITINRYLKSYYFDPDLIKMDVLYEFLGNGLKKFNPLVVDNIEHFYKGSIRSILGFYIKRDRGISTDFISLTEIENQLSRSGEPIRITYYRNALQTLQIKKLNKESPTFSQLIYNYNIFRNIIIDNEFQNTFLSSNEGFSSSDNDCYKLLKIYNMDQNKILDNKIRNLPLIYRLLRCIRIINPKNKPNDQQIVRDDLVKMAVLEELTYLFRNFISDGYINQILEKIAENFTDCILSGEYINPLTLSTVKINQINFIIQLREFIRICVTS